MRLPAPVLNQQEFTELTAHNNSRLASSRLSTCYPPGDFQRFVQALDELGLNALDAVAKGAGLLILSDHDARAKNQIPMLLAVAAVRQVLIKHHLGTAADIIVESAEARSVHHFACLLSYGAKAVYPSLAQATAEQTPPHLKASKCRSMEPTSTCQQSNLLGRGFGSRSDWLRIFFGSFNESQASRISEFCRVVLQA